MALTQLLNSINPAWSYNVELRWEQAELIKRFPNNTLSRKLFGLWTAIKPRPRVRTTNIASSHWNAVLQSQSEADQAMAMARRYALPLHAEPTKNWDLWRAFSFILNRYPKTARVLDMGAAEYSMLLPWLHLNGFRQLYGCDIVYQTEAFARGAIRYTRQNLEATDYPSGSFDVITSISVIEHGVDFERYCAETARLLRPGGHLITTTDFWCASTDTRGLEAYGHEIRVFAPDDIRELLRAAAQVGLMPVDDLGFECTEKVVRWDLVGLEFTTLFLILSKRL